MHHYHGYPSAAPSPREQVGNGIAYLQTEAEPAPELQQQTNAARNRHNHRQFKWDAWSSITNQVEITGEKQVGRAVGQRETPQSGLGAAEVTFPREDNSNNAYTKSPTLFTALFYWHALDRYSEWLWICPVSLSIPGFACLLLSIPVYSIGAYPDFSGNKEQDNGAGELYFQHFIAGSLSLPLCM